MPKGKGDPTAKILRARILHDQGMSKAKALKTVGYSDSSSKNPAAVWNSKTMKQLDEGIKSKFIVAGLGYDYYIEKFKEWLEAKSTVRDKFGTVVDEDPDYETQLKAGKEWGTILREGNENNGGKIKKRITFEEYSGWNDDQKEDPENPL